MSHDRVPGPEEIPARTPPQPGEMPVAGRKFVVGIGASAGGLDPLVRFFENLPKDTGMAFVIVQHLSPDFKSLMDELLARHTLLPIHLVEDGMPVEADHVYLIPAKKEMIISGGRLLLSERDRQQELTLPIDMFFRSLAQDCGADARRDRVVGWRQRRLARDPRRPRSRRARPGSGSRQRAVRRHAESGDRDRRRRPHAAARRTCRACCSTMPVAAPAAVPDAADGERPRAARPRRRCIACWKPSSASTSLTTSRAPSRAGSSGGLALAQSQNIDEYLTRLRSERDELDALYRDLLIGVTRFFRDPDAFALLEQHILPELLRREPRNAPLAPLGRRLRHGRGGVLAGDPSAGCHGDHGERPSRSSRPTSTAVRSSTPRSRPTARKPSRTSRRSARPLLHPERQHLPGRARAAADGRLCAAQRDQRRAVHAPRSHHLPEPADLPAAAGAAARAVVLPFRAQPGWRAVPRPFREPRAARATDSRSSTNTGSCIEKPARCERPSTCGSGQRVRRPRRASPSLGAARRQAFARAAAVGLRRAARRDDAAESAGERAR